MKMKMMVASAMLLGLIPTTAYAQQSSHDISAVTYTSVTQKAGNMNLNHNVKAAVSFTNADIQGATVNSINGSVNVSGSSVPFSLQGQLYRGINDTRVNGALSDTLGNFDVVRFEINSDPSNGIFFSKHLSGETVALYLQKKGTRDLTVVECPAAEVLGNSSLSSSLQEAKQFQVAPDDIVLWFEKYFQRDSRTVTREEQPSQVSQQTVISPMTTTTTKTWTVNYIDTYTLNGQSIRDEMDLQELIQEPSDTNANIIARLSVYHTYYTEGTTKYTDGPCGWRVGYNGQVGLRLDIPSPVTIRQEISSGHGWSVNSASFDFSCSVSYGILSGQLNFGSTSPSTIGSGCTTVDSSGNYSHAASWYADNNWYLKNPASSGSGLDFLEVSWDAKKVTGTASQNVTAQVSWIYHMIDINDGFYGYDAGMMDDNQSFSIYAAN